MSVAATSQTIAVDALKPGDRIRVCVKSLGFKLLDHGQMEDMPADPSCDRHKHWESRIISWCDFHKCWNIATPCRGERGNPNHAEWPFGHDALVPIQNENDWTKRSRFKVGMEAWAENPKWDHQFDDPPNKWNRERDHLQFFNGRRFGPARIVVPHIEPGDWYLGFPWQSLRHDHKRGCTVIAEDVFYKVVNESEFKPEGTT